MNRPEVIYLDAPYTLEGLEIRHTLEGLRYLVDHYETILANYPGKLDDKAKQHVAQLIINFKLRITLLEK